MSKNAPRSQRSQSVFTNSLFESALPSDWELVPVGEVLSSTQYGLSEPGDSSGNTAIVGMRDLSNGAVNLTDLATVDDGGDDWSSMRLRRGDILLNRTNSPDLVGKVGIVREDSDAVFASYLVRLNVERDKADPEFINFWLNTPIAQRALKRLSTRGVSQANINPTEFRKHCPFPLAPLNEQRKIAEILCAWHESIDKTSQLIAARKKQYLGLRDHLIDWRSEELTQLREVLKPILRPVEKPSGPYRALSIRSHGKGSYDRIVEDPSTVDMDTLYVAKAGDIIVNITFAWEGAIALVPPEHDGCLVSHRFPTFLPLKEKASERYLRHILRMQRFTYLLSLVSPGGAGRNRVLNKKDFLALEVPLPDLDEQEKAACILDDAERAIAKEIESQNALSRQMYGLMQKLLIGEWRVGREAAVA